MDVTSFLGVITGGNNVKIDIKITPPSGGIDPTKAVPMEHYPSWRLHKNPFWKVKQQQLLFNQQQQQQQIQQIQQQQQQQMIIQSTTMNTTKMNDQGNPYVGVANYNMNTSNAYPNYNNTTNMAYNNNQSYGAYPGSGGGGGGGIVAGRGGGGGGLYPGPPPDLVPEDPMNSYNAMQNNNSINNKEMLFAFEGSQDVEGFVIIRLTGNSTNKGQEHLGIKVQFLGRIEMGLNGGGHIDGKPRYDFISLAKELCPPGTLYQQETIFPFKFKNMDKEFESYRGRNVAVRYIIKVSMERKFLPVIKYEKDIWVQLLGIEPSHHEPIKMEVGIEDCLHIEFEYDRKVYHLEDMIKGRIHFLLVRIKIKHMELAVIRRETSGEGVAAAAGAIIGSGGGPPGSIGGSGPSSDATTSNTNLYTETQTLIKYEIMDGGPIRGEIIPVRLSLKGLPADLTPTYTAVNNRFSVRYFLNLVLVDEDDRRYFKQQEIVLYRKQLG